MSHLAAGAPAPSDLSRAAPAPRRVLVVADGASADIAELLIGATAPALLIGPAASALALITAAIAAQPPGTLDTLHIVAHGRPGGLSLGGRWIDTRALAAASAQLVRWKVATIALWSCHAAQEPTLTQVLAALTGAQVLASAGPLGMTDGAPRWDLVDADGRAVPAGFAAPFDGAVMSAWTHQLAR